MPMPSEDLRQRRLKLAKENILALLDDEWVCVNHIRKYLGINSRLCKDALFSLALAEDGRVEHRRVNNWINEFRVAGSSLEGE